MPPAHRTISRNQYAPVFLGERKLRGVAHSARGDLTLAILEAKKEGLPATHGLQQGKGYRGGHLHHVPFVFSSNGYLFVEYDDETGATTDERPLSEFPTPPDLVSRYLAQRGLPADPPTLALLTQPYHQGRARLRYY